MAKIYIAGPMSGLPDHGYPAFFAAEERLREQGHTPVNPARNPFVPNPEEFDFKSAYAWDIQQVIECDAIYMLRGWEKGAGARGEHAVACVMKRHNPLYEIIYE